MSGEKKKLLIIAGAIVGLVILTVIVLLIYNAIANQKMTYQKVENKVLAAAKKYYKQNKTLLPTKGEQTTIDDAALTAAGYLKSMSELTEKLNATCTARVIVSNNNNKYRYTTLLDCGEKYSTKTFVEYIKTKVPTTTTGSGLYELNGELVYRGEQPNNYIKFAGKMYRIVKIVDNKALLISNEKVLKSDWDNRYNTERNMVVGINDFSVSRAKETLSKLDLIKGHEDLVVEQTLYTGKRNVSDIYNDGTIEKSNIVEKQIYGLLPLYDYINASIDNNCVSAATRSCMNYNYLSKYGLPWWLITGVLENTHQVYKINMDGSFITTNASSSAYIRPTIMLISDAVYSSGNGTEKSPYIVK